MPPEANGFTIEAQFSGKQCRIQAHTGIGVAARTGSFEPGQRLGEPTVAVLERRV